MAIEASKFTEKDKLIAKFYTLRAGLSVIAEETDKIKAAEKELATFEEKNKEHNNQVLLKYNSELSKIRVPNYAELKSIDDHMASSIKYAILPGIATAIAGIFLTGIAVKINSTPLMYITGFLPEYVTDYER